MRAKLAAWHLASFGLAGAGVAVAGYLSGVHLAGVPLVCGEGGGCHTVQASRWAELGGVPVALLGLGMYLVVVALGLLRWRRPALAPAATLGAFALALAGAIFAAWLTYLELAVIGAVCRWCVASAAITFGLLGAEGVGVARLLVAPVSGDPEPPAATGSPDDGDDRRLLRPRGAAGV